MFNLRSLDLKALDHAANRWQDMLRRTGRCTKCGKRGVDLQRPSWDGSDTGWAPMAISQMAPPPDSAEPRRSND
jgi:hypothetical protein